jgi:hypothetical protein
MSIFLRVMNKRNLLPLVAAPAAIWSVDLLVHVVMKFYPTTTFWVVVLSFVLPAAGIFAIVRLYKKMEEHLDDMLPPEVPGILGTLYIQPVYLSVVMVLFQGAEGLTSPAGTLALMATVPVSTLILSIYDGSIFGVPLACAAMALTGRWMRNRIAARRSEVQ